MTSQSILVLFIVLGLLTAGLGYCLLALNRLRQRLNDMAATAGPPVVAPSPASPVTVSAAAELPALSSSPPPAGLAAALATEPSASAVSAPVLAVIAAAVHAALGGWCRVVTVVPAVSTASTSWSVEGRRDVFSSHQVR